MSAKRRWEQRTLMHRGEDRIVKNNKTRLTWFIVNALTRYKN